MSLARVACVIPARDAAETIIATVTAARQLPGVDVVIVADDHGSDESGARAAATGAIVVTHQRSRGAAAAIESAVNALGVLEQRDRRPECGTVLLLDPAIGADAHRLAPVVDAIRHGSADLVIAVPAGRADSLPDQAARRGVAQLTQWSPRAPLSPYRCLTRRAYELASPLAAGSGWTVGMAVDLHRAGLRIEELEADLPEEAGSGLQEKLQQAGELRDLTRALAARGLVKSGLEDLDEAGGLPGLLQKWRGR